jgi:hypothetical protein
LISCVHRHVFFCFLGVHIGPAPSPNKSRMAGVEGLEPTTYGFGDRRSTS